MGILDVPARAEGAAKAVRVTSQSLSSGVVTAVSFSSAAYDTASFWAGGAPTRLTVPAKFDGRLALLVGLFDFESIVNTSVPSIIIKKNGTVILDKPEMPSAANHVAMNAAMTDVVATSDYYELFGYENAGTKNIQTANFIPQFTIAIL